MVKQIPTTYVRAGIKSGYSLAFEFGPRYSSATLVTGKTKHSAGRVVLGNHLETLGELTVALGRTKDKNDLIIAIALDDKA